MTTDNKRTGRGGARLGAGRKAFGGEPGIPVSITIPRPMAGELRAFLKARKMTYAAFIAEALRLMQ